MGIKLDWDVESDDGWDEIKEDPAAAAARQQARRRWMVATLLLLLIVVGLVGGGVWRLRLLESESRTELETTVLAETTALRIGDQRAFLDIQAPIDSWREAQASNFENYQQGEAVSGEIFNLDINLDRGVVTLREQRGGQPVLVTWFYQRSSEGWQHIPPALDQWDEVQTASEAFDIDYRSVDADYIAQLAPLLDGWWSASRHAVGVTGPVPRPTIRVSAMPETRWADYDSWTLLIPSPQVRPRPADGSLDAGQTGEIADRLAERWASLAVDTGNRPDPASDLSWYKDELALWLRREIAPDLPSSLASPGNLSGSTFIDSVDEAVGGSIVSTLTQAVRTSGHIVPALEEVTREPVTALDVDWRSYFTYQLKAEAESVRSGSVAEVDRLYRDPNRQQRMPGEVSDYAVEQVAVVDTIDVVKTLPLNDLLLAEVHFSVQEWPAQRVVDNVAYEPFRLVDGRWVHTWLVADDWGETLTFQTEHFEVQYQALDASMGNWLSAEMETLYAKLVALLHLEPDQQPERVLLVLTPLRTEFATGGDLFVRYRNAPWIVVTSPYAGVWSSDRLPWESVYQSTASQLANLLVGQMVTPLTVRQPIAAAFASWAVKQADPGYRPIPPVVSQQVGFNNDVTVVSLWPDEMERTGQVQRHYDPIDYIAAEALVDVLVDTYGAESVPALVAGMPTAASLDEWLAVSIGGSADDIAPAWRQRFDAMNLQP